MAGFSIHNPGGFGVAASPIGQSFGQQSFTGFDPGGFAAALRTSVEVVGMRTLMFALTGENDFLQADQFYFADLQPLNNSGVDGVAVFAFDDDTDTLTIAVAANGLEPNLVHPHHIHGFVNGADAQEPTMANDTDGDGYVEGFEGGPIYGPVMLGLPNSTAPGGILWQITTVQLPAGTLGADPMLSLREYNIHGLTVPAGVGAGTQGEVDGSGGYKASLVVAGAEIEQAETTAELRAALQGGGFDDIARDAFAAQLREAVLGWFT